MQVNFEDYLKTHFSNRGTANWKQPSAYILNLLNTLDITPTTSIIDVGCGYNNYKKFYKNLVGIDIVDNGADIVSSIQNAKNLESSFEIALCLGVLHGSFEHIENDIIKILTWIKPNGYIIFRARKNPKPYDYNLTPYYLNLNIIKEYTNKFNLTLLDTYTKDTTTSIIWVWKKNGS